MTSPPSSFGLWLRYKYFALPSSSFSPTTELTLPYLNSLLSSSSSSFSTTPTLSSPVPCLSFYSYPCSPSYFYPSAILIHIYLFCTSLSLSLVSFWPPCLPIFCNFCLLLRLTVHSLDSSSHNYMFKLVGGKRGPLIKQSGITRYLERGAPVESYQQWERASLV